MTIERGFRRLTLLASITLAALGLGYLGVTVPEEYGPRPGPVTAEQVARSEMWDDCMRRRVRVPPDLADFVVRSMKREADNGKVSDLIRECNAAVANMSISPETLARAAQEAVRRNADAEAAWRRRTADLLEHTLVNALLVALVAASPWGFFYLGRWLVRGFAGT